MNKIQYIKLLEMRGITELKGDSIAKAIEKTGGEPTLEEMVKTNEESMKYYMEKWNEEKLTSAMLKKQIEILNTKLEELEERDVWLTCLESAGVDNWEGYGYAMELFDNEEEE